MLLSKNLTRRPQHVASASCVPDRVGAHFLGNASRSFDLLHRHHLATGRSLLGETQAYVATLMPMIGVRLTGGTPRRLQSGTSIDYEGRITKQGDVNVREALCEAAASLLLRVRRWSALRAWRLRVAKRSSILCAIVAVARKLAGILHRMWISETDFNVFGAKVTQRLRLKPAQ